MPATGHDRYELKSFGRMKEALEQIEAIRETISTFQGVSQRFLGECLEQIGRDSRYRHGEAAVNLAELWNNWEPENYEAFCRGLVSYVAERDEHGLVSEVCGLLRGNLPNDAEVASLLREGIEDTSKSNRLRERFFWCYNFDFKDDALRFFQNDFAHFLIANEDNEELCADVIDNLHWHLRSGTPAPFPAAVEASRAYVEKNPAVRSELLSSTLELLGIEEG